MLNLTQINNFRHNFFNEKRNLDYLTSTYGQVLCEQKMFLTIIQIDDELQYHTKIYHSTETYDDLIEIYKTLCKNKPEDKLQKIINKRNEFKQYITQNVNIDKKIFYDLSYEFDKEETFHLATLIHRFNNNLNKTIKKRDSFYCFSEIYDALSIENYSDEINFNVEEALHDNPAHVRVIFKKQNDDICMYDPDICMDFYKIKQFFDYFVDENVDTYHYLEKFVPIQEITDDCYCLFHCLRILQLIDKYDMHNYNKIYSRITRHKHMKKWISKLHKKIMLHEA